MIGVVETARPERHQADGLAQWCHGMHRRRAGMLLHRTDL